MHVDLDAFFVEVCRTRMPELQGVELLVVGGRRHSRGVVQSASYGARRYGVRAGMPVSRAVALCPDATFVQGEFAWYREASHRVRDLLARFAPHVAMAGLDEGYLDFSGTERLYPGSLLPVAETIRDIVQSEAGLAVSIGIAPNRMVAKLASDAAKPRGLMEVRAGWEEGFLAGLPLRALPGIGPATARRLADRGLVDVWQVQRMAEPALRQLVGDDARALKRRAHGHGGTVLRPDRLPRSVSRETTLQHDLRDQGALQSLLLLFASRVAAQLRDEHLVARTVVLKVRQDDFTTLTRRVTLREATDLEQDLYGAALPMFARAFGDIRQRHRAVRLVGLAATNLAQARESDLFEAPERARLRKLTAAVDQVRERFGDGAVAPARVVQLRTRTAGPGTPQERTHGTRRGPAPAGSGGDGSPT
jgi:DNA polymerase-4